tara:strand:+ start:5000 stop:5656 length:657 start_codon:yes stop_codon:yes gene_type:complete
MSKAIIILSFSLIIVSCSTAGYSRIAPGYSEAFKAIKNAIVGFEDQLITKELVKNIPYASSSMKIGKGPSGLIILESINSNNLTWVSADDVYLVTRNGRIIRTAGLNNNLIEFNGPYRKKSLLNQIEGTKNSYYSYDSPYLTNLEVKAKIKKKGNVKVELLAGERTLILIEEEIRNDFIGWSEVNKFWLDEEGFVWKSEQYISPKLPKIILEVTKKPS